MYAHKLSDVESVFCLIHHFRKKFGTKLGYLTLLLILEPLFIVEGVIKDSSGPALRDCHGVTRIFAAMAAYTVSADIFPYLIFETVAFVKLGKSAI